MKSKFPVMLSIIFWVSVTSYLCLEGNSSNPKLGFTNLSDEETIFMRLRRSLVNKINQSEDQKAKFSMAEYYFKHQALLDAFRAFKKYVENYSPGSSTLLAKIYLYKIANLKKDTAVADSLKKEIFDNSFILLFSQFKVLKYKSAFNNHYEIHYYVDKIKVFLNGGDFEEVTP